MIWEAHRIRHGWRWEVWRFDDGEEFVTIGKKWDRQESVQRWLQRKAAQRTLILDGTA